MADSTNRGSSLALRLASVAVLIPVIVAAAWFYWLTVALVAACIAVAIVELFAILRQAGYAPRNSTGVVVGLLFCAAAALRPMASLDLTGLALTLGIVLTLGLELARRDRSTSLVSWAFTFAGAAYIGWLLSAFILLHQLNTPLLGGLLAPLGIPSGAAWVMLVLAITWIQDSAAFFVGRSIGRTPMAPILSPKKSWEGFAGGMLGSVLTAIAAVPLLGLPIGYVTAVLIGISTGIAGPIGDLAESLIKRQVGVKDSGALIPGHGGILDRMDSLLLTAPVVYYAVLLTLAF